MATDFKKVIKREYLKCVDDPVYFMRKYCTIQHPQRGKMKFDLYDFGGINGWTWSRSQELEQFLDNLGDALQWQDMKKGESKEVGTVSVLCIDRNLKVDTSDDDWIAAEGDILIMLTYDEYPDDTIKIRFKINGEILEDGELDIWEQSTYYLDSEGQDNPLDYSGFQELDEALKRIIE